MFIMEKTSTLLNETIHILLTCALHLHRDRNKVVPFMKPFILVDLSNGVKFCNCACWSTNDTRSHCLSRQVNNYHIGNEDLILLGHVQINS